MFFLGISAHLFIYLLLPAFLMVCFYFRGTSGNPEVIPSLPETIVYEHRAQQTTEDTYVYQEEKYQAALQAPAIDSPENITDTALPIADAVSYLSPFLHSSGLRAPPVL